MATKYENFLSGTITNNPLTVGGTNLTSAALADLGDVTSGDVMWLVLDPDGSDGAPEIVQLTSHVDGETSATIVRGQQGTIAREHVSGINVRNVVTRLDLESFLVDEDLEGEGGTLASGRLVYRKVGGWVDVEVHSDGSQPGLVAATTMPAGFLPTGNVIVPGVLAAAATFAAVRIEASTGYIKYYSGGSWVDPPATGLYFQAHYLADT